VLDRLLAPEFKWVHAFGYVDDKATVLREAAEDPMPRGRSAFNTDPPRRLTISGDLAVLASPGVATGTGTPAFGTTIFVRREGRWQLLLRQGTELNATPTELPLHPAAQQPFTGRWLSGERSLTVERRGDGHHVITGRFLPRRLTPIGPDLFTTKIGDEVHFTRDSNGKPVTMTFTWRGSPTTYRRAD
jgi:hypothetical protein